MDKRTLKAAMSEIEVMSATGLTEDALRSFRTEYMKKEDWFYDSTKIVQYTKKGVAKLKEALGDVSIAPPPVQEALQVTQPMPIEKKMAAPTGKVMDFRIERICPNPTWVRVRLPDGDLVNVRVRNNQRMTVGGLLAGCEFNGSCWVYGGKR